MIFELLRCREMVDRRTTAALFGDEELIRVVSLARADIGYGEKAGLHRGERGSIALRESGLFHQIGRAEIDWISAIVLRGSSFSICFISVHRQVSSCFDTLMTRLLLDPLI